MHGDGRRSRGKPGRSPSATRWRRWWPPTKPCFGTSSRGLRRPGPDRDSGMTRGHGRRGPRTYVLVNHLTGAVSDGIGNYSRAVLDELRREGIETAFITRDEGVSDADYRTFVLNAVTT